MIEHYYHVYSKGNWQVPAREHMEFLQAAGLLPEIDVFRVGVIGPVEGVLDILRGAELIVHEDQGWEQATLVRMRSMVRDESFVLYCHTKGASREHVPEGRHWADDIGRRWRRYMSSGVIGKWREAVQALDDGFDTAGCQWLIRDNRQCWPGTFWWARGDYLKSLPAIGLDNRFQAEPWIGLNPVVHYHDLTPEFPWRGANWPEV